MPQVLIRQSGEFYAIVDDDLCLLCTGDSASSLRDLGHAYLDRLKRLGLAPLPAKNLLKVPVDLTQLTPNVAEERQHRGLTFFLHDGFSPPVGCEARR